MANISKESPTWVIDGSNKVYTLLNTPDYILDIYVDWAIYTSFTLSWNQITLTDAPTLSIFVDYETASTTVQTSTNVSWGDVKEQIWVNLWQTSNSTTFSNSVLDAEMNSLVGWIYRGRVQNPLNSRIYRAWALNFINGSSRFRYIPNTTLSVAVALWDTEISMDTTFLLESWVVEIWGDIITYTAKTDTQITGVSWITILHIVWESVVALYEMPEEMDKANKVEYIINDSTLAKKELVLDNTWFAGKYYQILKNANDNYIKVIWLETNDIIEVDYIKKHTNITDDSTVFPIPDMYWLSVVANIVSGKLWYIKWIPYSEQQLMVWFTELQSFFQFYTNEINVIKQSLRAKSYSSMRRS